MIAQTKSKVTNGYQGTFTQGKVTHSDIIHTITQVKIILGRVTWVKSTITYSKDKVIQGKFNVGTNTWGKVTFYRVTWGKFDQGILIQGRDEVTKGKYHLGRNKYPGRVTRDKFNKGIITQGKFKDTQGKFYLDRYKYLGRVTLGRVTQG